MYKTLKRESGRNLLDDFNSVVAEDKNKKFQKVEEKIKRKIQENKVKIRVFTTIIAILVQLNSD